jgi:Kef-type K+ transport system membrane component KefB
LADIFFLQSLGLMVLAAAAALLLARFASVPSIVAYILAGLALGPGTGLLTVTEAIEVISEAGIVLLLFLVGLELSFEKIRDVGKVALVAGLGQIAFTVSTGYVLSRLLGFNSTESLILGTALTFSSTIVAVKLLTQKNELDSLYGRIAVGISLVQSLAVIVIVTFVSALGGAGEFDLPSIGGAIALSFLGMVALLATALASARWVLPRIFGWMSSSLEGLFIWSLSWCFLLVVAAQLLGLTIEIGAFIAGLSLAQLPYVLELRNRVRPLMNFFIAIFFTSLGVRMEVQSAIEAWFPALVLSVFVIVANSFFFMWVIARFGYGEGTAFRAGVSMAQVSEFSFILAALMLANGFIDETFLSIFTLVGLVTIAVSTYLILYNGELYERLRGSWFLRLFRARPDAEAVGEERPQALEGHVIVVGLNALGSLLIEELKRRGETVLAIDTDPRKLGRYTGHKLLGNVDNETVLKDANFHQAKLVVSALQIEDVNNLLAYRCRQEEIPCSIHAFDRSVVHELRLIGATHLMIPKNNGVRRMIEALRERGFVES